jgi:competence protein ComFC
MKKVFKSLKKLLLEVFLPEICVSCEKEGETLCKECRSEIKRGEYKSKNFRGQIGILAPLSYKNEKIKKALFALKYRHTRSVAKYLAILVVEDFLEFIKEVSESKDNYKDLILIPIPISKKRYIARDYNQSELILRNIILLLKNKNIYLEENIKTDLLKKEKHTIKFADTHAREEREKLIENAYTIDTKVCNKTDTDLQNKKIILLDDITTTGATFYEAIKTLMKSGAKRENIFCFAVAH